MRQSPSLHTGIERQKRRNRRKLLLSGDYSRRPPNGHDPRGCEECGSEYRPRFSWQRYCSKRCRKRAESRRYYVPRERGPNELKMERRALTCEMCGTEYLGFWGRYCGKACINKAWKLRHRGEYLEGKRRHRATAQKVA